MTQLRQCAKSTADIIGALQLSYPIPLGVCAVGGMIENTGLIEALPCVEIIYSGISIIRSFILLGRENPEKLKLGIGMLLHAADLGVSIAATQTSFSQTKNLADLSSYFLEMAVINLGNTLAHLHYIPTMNPVNLTRDEIERHERMVYKKALSSFIRAVGYSVLALGPPLAGWILFGAAALFETLAVKVPVGYGMYGPQFKQKTPTAKDKSPAGHTAESFVPVGYGYSTPKQKTPTHTQDRSPASGTSESDELENQPSGGGPRSMAGDPLISPAEGYRNIF